MNSGICRCLRYIDDFIILAPDKESAEQQFAQGRRLLARHGLEASQEKEFRGDITRGFVFLGVELANGTIKPSRESRRRMLQNVSTLLREGASAFRSHGKTGTIDPSLSLIRTLYEVRGIVSGWGHHYSFCNEQNIFSQLDQEVDHLLREYLGTYGDSVKRTDPKGRRLLLGVPLLERLASRPFLWTKPKTPQAPPLSLQGANVPNLATSRNSQGWCGPASAGPLRARLPRSTSGPSGALEL